MVSSKATSAADYLAQLPAEKRAVVAAVRDVVLEHLPAGYVEGIHYGMLSWYVPLERYPDTYNGNPIALGGLAAQKQYFALYLLNVYGDPETEAWFRGAFAKAGKKLDMGKSCVRFKKLEDLPLDVIGEAFARWPVEKLIAHHDAVHGGSIRKVRERTTGKPAKRKAVTKKRVAKKAKPAKKKR